MQLLVKTFTGLEPVLERELSALGATSTRIVSRGVLCEGPERLLYRANLELRCGLRVYRHLADVDAASPTDFYRAVGSYDWGRHLSTRGTLWVTSTVGRSAWVRNSTIVTLKAKDAIVDALRRGDARPQVDKERPDLRVHAYVHEDRGSVWLDSTGDPLFRRGYRLRQAGAPINQVLAAGILQLAEWRPSRPLVDPMCGAGTFAIEAARLALNVPSQQERRYFAFMNWPDFDERTWSVVKQQAYSRIQTNDLAPIVASDRDRRAVRYASDNLRAAGVAAQVELHEADFFDVSAPLASGMLVVNPPYDERFPLEDGEAWYRDVGAAFKHLWSGWEAYVVSGFAEGLRALGLTPKRKWPLDNGGLPVELWRIPLYEGSRREPRDAEASAAAHGSTDVDDEAFED